MKRLALAAVLLVLLVGPARAGFDEGLAANERGDYATALKEFRPLAEQGNAGAQYHLGLMYRHGNGLTQDYTEVVKWFRKAADQGNASAQFNLGFMVVNPLARCCVQIHTALRNYPRPSLLPRVPGGIIIRDRHRSPASLTGHRLIVRMASLKLSDHRRSMFVATALWTARLKPNLGL